MPLFRKAYATLMGRVILQDMGARLCPTLPASQRHDSYPAIAASPHSRVAVDKSPRLRRYFVPKGSERCKTVTAVGACVISTTVDPFFFEELTAGARGVDNAPESPRPLRTSAGPSDGVRTREWTNFAVRILA